MGSPAERRRERNWIWVEDVTSGKVVTGEKPPDDKAEEKGPAIPPPGTALVSEANLMSAFG